MSKHWRPTDEQHEQDDQPGLHEGPGLQEGPQVEPDSGRNQGRHGEWVAYQYPGSEGHAGFDSHPGFEDHPGTPDDAGSDEHPGPDDDVESDEHPGPDEFPEFDYGDHPVERAVPTAVGAYTGRRAQVRAAHRRKKRGQLVGILAVATVLVLLLGGGFVAYKLINRVALPADYAGPGGPEVVIQVHPGDTAEQIAAEMANKDVVASASAFFNAAVRNDAMSSVQPGFYRIATQLPAASAVAALVSPQSRVGTIVISEGRQLHDIRDVHTGAVRKGIYTLISEASCIGSGDARHCISYDELNTAGANTDLAALGVPDWSQDRVRAVPDRSRQLEGLIAAGSWDFDPTQSATQILHHLVSDSSASYDETGIRTVGTRVGLNPYQMLIAASLIERESLPPDFTKVARVILNRLAVGQPLEFDSTVNYALPETELATTDADRATVTPWNTYASTGLPATPIASPSIAALKAIENPADGDWLYFVTVDDKGTTMFTHSYAEHLHNTQLAVASGILKSGR